MAHILVIGAGAIGCTIAAWLDRSGEHRVSLGVRSPVERLVIETQAARSKPHRRS